MYVTTHMKMCATGTESKKTTRERERKRDMGADNGIDAANRHQWIESSRYFNLNANVQREHTKCE